jgi:hypothetical protein
VSDKNKPDNIALTSIVVCRNCAKTRERLEAMSKALKFYDYTLESIAKSNDSYILVLEFARLFAVKKCKIEDGFFER